MGMVVQHNISAQNANNALTKNVSGLKKSTEKLSTGYQINRAADNAAGLAISEKMRSQIRGLSQATNNANDAISLIQTAEGGLQETEDIMQRMRELAVQSANGTYTDEDREQIQYEVDALKAEVDRIAQSTEFNEMKLLDGSLDGGVGNTGNYGPRYGVVLDDDAGDLFAGTSLTSNLNNVTVTVKAGDEGATKGGECAEWNEDGTELTIKLAKGESYTQKQIDEIIKGANVQKEGQLANVPEVRLNLANGVITAKEDESQIGPTEGGVRAYTDYASLAEALVGGVNTDKYADSIKFIANSYGDDQRAFTIKFDAEAGKESVEASEDNEETSYKRDGEYTIHLSTGKEYTANDIEKIMAKGGLDYTVDLIDSEDDNTAPDGDKVLYANTKTEIDCGQLGDGKGVFKDLVEAVGEGLVFQIGANGVEDQRLELNISDMSTGALGISAVDVSKRDAANEGINTIDDALKLVSTQRAKLGAVQNRLEHTVNSLNTANENLSAAESQIRDTDMASEMIKYTKSNILQQASQSMLAQANQQPQGVLQLLG